MRAVQGSRFSVWFYRAMCADLLRERRVAALRRKDSSAELGDALQLGLGDSLGLDVGGGKLRAHVRLRVAPEAGSNNQAGGVKDHIRSRTTTDTIKT